ncbi:ornithine cyclodeaminase family protein [Pseudoteredinibacter isoporae]|uniref:Ornithine cyclodeaminase n=1 Tax=Pseudoteredinibacter isoporae TaxID=570281 RepID=A0A7X0JS96_9GAMM|nr:ornithine cyclodeaminase family protein [Pseudoteredinibacter isoporae]MBB6520406.1 ornithine cyclodeaminase [Pseudoteredinibacter isoporae]NHO85974.1 ornithine cyclodeaminase family protein [Pseudoteredinibacter isoporae]NIB25574.1 ornithine cyclodeaminase family protein [Pseudoteredinibacter isoporae]
MDFIDQQTIDRALPFEELVDALQQGFASDIETPLRNHYDIPNPHSSRETTLLMMPSWQAGSDIGIKLVTVTPESHKFDLPSIQGTYVLFDAVRGCVKATMDAPALTAKRTAAASALASRFMSRPNSRKLLMVGTGTLSSQLIRAHASVRPIEEVVIWGRNPDKAQAIAELESLSAFKVQVAKDLGEAVKDVDIISVATMSTEPLIMGDWLQEGQHLDLVGAYRPDMREADDECIRRSRIVVDNYTGACKETGDIATPLANGVLQKDDICADLFQLCREERTFLRNDKDISLFKSVGHALEDLAAAQLVVKSLA